MRKADPHLDVVAFARDLLGIDLQRHQGDAIRAEASVKTVEKGRQVGGTVTMIVKGGWDCYRFPRHLALYTSASERQVTEIGERAVEVFEAGPIRESITRRTSERIAFSNGSEMVFVPNNARTIRGFGVRGLLRRRAKRPGVTAFFDECAHAEGGDSTRKAIEYALATAPADRRELWLVTTPTTSDSWVQKYFDLGQQGEPGFWSARWPSELNKYVDRLWLASKRRTSLPAEIATEIDGCPSDDVQALFAPLLSQITGPHPWPARPQRDRVCTVGIDLHLLFSHGSDYSVAVLLGQGADPIVGGRTLVCDLWREKNYMEADLLAVLERWCAEHTVEKILIESFASSGIVEGCLRRGLPVETIAPTPQNQAAAFTRLYTLAKENRLLIPVGAEALIEELKILRHTISDTGIPRFSAPSGRHDDTCFALAWATHALGSVAPMELRFAGAGVPSRPAGMSRLEWVVKQKQEDSLAIHAAIIAAEAEKDRELQEDRRQQAEDFAYRVRRDRCVFPGD